jgi:hypothetical protein
MGLNLRILCASLVNIFSFEATALASSTDIPPTNLRKGAWVIAQSQEIEGRVAHAPDRLTGAGCHDDAKLMRETLAPLEKLGCSFVLVSQRDGKAIYAGTCTRLGQGERAKMIIESGNPTEFMVTISAGKDRITKAGHWKTECLQGDSCADILKKQ